MSTTQKLFKRKGGRRFGRVVGNDDPTIFAENTKVWAAQEARLLKVMRDPDDDTTADGLIERFGTFYYNRARRQLHAEELAKFHEKSSSVGYHAMFRSKRSRR